MREEAALRVAAQVQLLAADLLDAVRGEDRAVGGADQPALDRELRDALDLVVLPVGQAGGGPGLPVGRGHNQRREQADADETQLGGLPVHPRSAFARLDTSRRPASSTKLATTLEPPYEMNGSVMPVSGISRRIPPTMMKVCSAKAKVSPIASSFEKPSSASIATLKPRATKSM